MQELLLVVNLDGNQKIVHIQHLKKLKFSAEKYKVLKISALKNTDTVCVDGNHLKLKMSLSIGSKGDNVSLCKSSVNTTVGSIIEISVRCQEANFGKNEISNLLLLYNSVFVPRLLQSHGQTFLRMTSSVQKIRNLILLIGRIMDVPRSAPTAVLYLELGIPPAPIPYQFEKRQ